MNGRYRDYSIELLQQVFKIGLLRQSMRSLIHTGIVPRAVWRRLRNISINEQFKVKVDEQHTFNYVSSGYDRIGSLLYWGNLKGYEPEVIKTFITLVPKAQTILDLGANTGLFTLVACALNPTAEVIAVEAMPRVFEHLERNVEANNWMSRCTLVSGAVSSTPGKATLFNPLYEDRYTVMAYAASLHEDWEHPNKPREQIEVDVVTVDQICPPDKKVSIIKMDVEGVEDQVLEGMKRVLSESKPSIILELRPDGPAERIKNLLLDNGYKNFWRLTADGPDKVDQITDFSTLKGNYNYLASCYTEWQIVDSR